MVLGFQGGDYNERLKFYSVFARDAHAWIEYYDENHWASFDPTYVLAPTRINQGFNSFVREQETNSSLFSKITLPIVWFIQDLTEDVRSNYEFLWNTFLDLFSTSAMFSEIVDLVSRHSTEMLMLLLLLLFWLLLRRQKEQDILEKIMDNYCKILLRKGYAKLPSEGYHEFVERILIQSDFDKLKHREFINLWMQAYYSDKSYDIEKIDLSLKRIKKELS